MAGLPELNSEIAKKKKEIVIGDFLDLRRTSVKSLPDNLTVRGNLFLSDSKIAVLPNNLTVLGSLYLSRTKIRFLPDSLTVQGSLNVSYTDIIELPTRLKVSGTVYGLEENQKRLEEKKTDCDKKAAVLMQECRREIMDGWKIFYSEYLDEIEKYPPLSNKQVTLTELIERFSVQAKGYMGEKFPMIRSVPCDVFWGIILSSIEGTYTHRVDDLKSVRDEIAAKHSSVVAVPEATAQGH
jgi:hypothetical protein